LRENKRLSPAEEREALTSFEELQIQLQSNRRFVREFLLNGFSWRLADATHEFDCCSIPI
jgi:hypothetical protein